MKKIFILSFLVFSLFTTAQKSNMSWETDYFKVLKEARDTNKNIIVFFTDNSTSKAQQKFFASSEFSNDDTKYLYLKLFKADIAPNQDYRNFTLRLSSVHNKGNEFPAVMVMDAFNTEKVPLLKSFDLKSTKAFFQELNSL